MSPLMGPLLYTVCAVAATVIARPKQIASSRERGENFEFIGGEAPLGEMKPRPGEIA